MKKISWSDLTKEEKQGYIDGYIDGLRRDGLKEEIFDEDQYTQKILEIEDIFDKDQEIQKILTEERVQKLENFFDNNLFDDNDLKYTFSLDDELGIKIYKEDLVDDVISYKDFYALYMARGVMWSYYSKKHGLA
jgi:hypothetical protein